MRSLKLTEIKKLEVIEEALPEIADDEVLIQVKKCGICGSDVAGYLGVSGRRLPPMTMGHEFSGEIAEIGAGVTTLKKGDRVTVQPWKTCGECEFCKMGKGNFCRSKTALGVLSTNGAMAEYVKAAANQVFRLPDNLSFEAAAFTEPFAVAYGAVKCAGDLAGKDVAIVGGGTIALCILQLVRLAKPSKIILLDRKDARLTSAKRFGADETVNTQKEDAVQRVAEITGGRMADISFEAVGVEATAQLSLGILHPGARAVWVGMNETDMTIDMQQIVKNALEVHGSFNYTQKEFGETLEILAGGGIETEALITKTISLEETEETILDMSAHSEKYSKVMIDPWKK